MRHAIADYAVNTTYTDVGSADIASLHGCNLLGQCICTGRTVLGQCRSYCRGENICHPCKLDSSIPAENRMGDTLSFKINNKVLYIQHLDRSRYDSTDFFRLKVKIFILV